MDVHSLIAGVCVSATGIAMAFALALSRLAADGINTKWSTWLLRGEALAIAVAIVTASIYTKSMLVGIVVGIGPPALTGLLYGGEI